MLTRAARNPDLRAVPDKFLRRNKQVQVLPVHPVPSYRHRQDVHSRIRRFRLNIHKSSSPKYQRGVGGEWK